MLRLAILASLVLSLCACASEPKAPDMLIPDEASLASDGRDIAEAQCAACHSVGRYGSSPNPAAPPFRNVLARYDSALLEENLINGIQVAHPMPEFQFNPKGVDALIVYLKSIDDTPKVQH